MKPDPFEHQLQRQRIRKIPETWREQMLSAAQKTYECNQSPGLARWRTTLKSKVLGVLWPSPKAWASLGAVWLLTAVLNVATNDRRTAVAPASSLTRDLVSSWKDQERHLSEVMHFYESPGSAPESSRPASSPRSEQSKDPVI